MARKVLNVCIVVFYCTFSLISCGGGAGGASIPAGEYTTHNNSGWGGNGSNGSNGGSNNGVNTTGGTPIVVANYVYNGNSYSKDQINDLIQVIRDNPGQPEGVFTVQFYVEGDSDPRYARVTKSPNGVEKFEHQYKATCINGSNTTVRTFYKDDSLNLSDLTTSNMAGWRCSQNAVLYGSVINGFQGDITLTAEFVSFSTSRENNKTQLVATSDVSVIDSETITITGGSGTFSVTGDSYLDVTEDIPNTQYTVSIKINGTAFIGFNDNATGTITITDTGVTPNETQTVSFALKNMYTYQLKDASGADVGSPVQKNAGETLDFNTAKGAIPADPTGRAVVAFKNDAGNVVLCGNTSPGPTSLTFNSMTFTSRFINLQAVLDFTMTTKNAASTVWNATQTYSSGGDSGPLYTLEKFSTTNKELHVTITDCSANSNLSVTKAGDSQNFLEIAQTSLTTAGTFVVKLTSNVTHDSIGADYIYPITVTDSGTGTSKVIFVKIAQPPAYKYSLVYQRSSGGSPTTVQISGWQDKTFEPGTTLRFGVSEGVSTLKMGDLDSTLTGLEAAISITGWKSTRASNPPIYNNPFPNVAPADCESDNSITLIATTEFGNFYDNCRADENAVQNGDIMLSSGLCVNKTFYTNHTSLLNSYVVGSVCIRDGNQKFIVGKNNLSGNYHIKWSNSTDNNSSLAVSITGTETGDSSSSMPRYDISSNGVTLTFSNSNSGKNSMNSVNINNYPAFKYCNDYGNNFSGTFNSGWYLPSIAEAYALYKNNVIQNQWIVSSSQFDSSKYWCVIGNQQILVTRSKTEEDNRSKIYPCHEFTFVAP